MRSSKRGGPTSAVELSNVSPHGLWIFFDGRELYLSFDHFPWFRDATIAQLAEIERPRPEHLHWPLLDVDLTVDSILHPESFPRVSRSSARKTP